MVATQIQLDPVTHTYTMDGLNGRKLPSVSTLVNALKPKFDAPVMARRVADRDHRTVASVLAEWEAKRQASFATGRAVHEAIQAELTEDKTKTGCIKGEFVGFMQWWNSAKAHMKPKHIEHIIADPELGVAGTTDAVFSSAKSGLDHVFDWKTGGNFETTNRYGGRLLAPFEDLWNCELACYSLQTSIYRLILERNLGQRYGESWVLHLRSDNSFQAYPAINLCARAEQWLRSRL